VYIREGCWGMITRGGGRGGQNEKERGGYKIVRIVRVE